MMEYNFKKYKLSANEIIWMQELYKLDFASTDIKGLLLKLSHIITEDFIPEKINWQLVRNNRLTLLGIWLIDSSSNYFKLCNSVMDGIINLIKSEPSIKEIDAEDLRLSLPVPVRTIKICFTLLSDFGFFNGGSSDIGEIIFNKVTLSNESNVFGKLIRFKSIELSIEQFFNEFNNFNSNSNLKSSKKLKNDFVVPKDDIWQKINKDFKVSKQTFGKKINFVTDKNKKQIIFRDVEQAFQLSKIGFYKPTIILAGGVIEELLRIYLLSKNIQPKNNTFDEYIKSCVAERLLTKAVSTLTDSQRHFRNFVHLEKEVSFNSVTNSMAQGALASIFTLINDF